jgi:3-oxoacyl-[acyl-carrier protein] reductase
VACRADVTKKRDVEGMAVFALESLGRIDFLINNAGLSTRTLVEDMSEEEWDLVLNTNLKGTFLCSQAVIQTMKAQGGGRIVNITSGRGIGGQVKGTHYSASKAGMMGFAKSLSLEVARYGINVNSVAPGTVDTWLWRRGKSQEEIEALRKADGQVSNPLLRRTLIPEDVVGAVVFLLSDASKMMTGQTVFLRSP